LSIKYLEEPKIFALNLNNSQNVELHLQLATWGYYQEQIELYKILLGKISPSVDIVCLIGLGKASTLLSNYNLGLSLAKLGRNSEALSYLQLSLKIFHEIGLIFREEQVLRILIKLCHKSQRHLLAIKYHFILCRLKQLQISQNPT